jgi:nucleoside-diphosphate-sugar epimerase
VDWYRQNRAFDITRAKQELGYAPRVPLDEGLRRTGRWYRERNYLKVAEAGDLAEVSPA